MPPPAGSTRRQQRREATLAEIGAAARAALAAEGPDAVTLRGIATHLGMAPAGVHYYFPTRDDLIAAVIVDAFDDLAAVTEAAVDGTTGPSSWREAALACRRWALDNPELFALAHSTTAARLKERPGLLDAKDRAVRALMNPLAAAVAAGQLRPPATPGRITAALRSQLGAWSAAAGVPGEQRVLLYLVHAYTVVQGSILLSINASLPRELLAGDEVFRAQLELVLEGR